MLSSMLRRSLAVLALVTVTSPALAAPSKVDPESYTLEMRPAGSCKVNTTCVVELVLTTKGPWKTNSQYPFKVVVSSTTAGVTPTKTPLLRADATTNTPTKLAFRVSFKATSAGNTNITTRTSLSLVDAGNGSVMDKVDLALTVPVQP